MLDAVVDFSSLPANSFNSADESFLIGTDYIGAVRNSSDTWYLGWTLPGTL